MSETLRHLDARFDPTRDRRAAHERSSEVEAMLERLVDVLASRVADELEARRPLEAPIPPSTAALLTLDEVVAELPAGKRPETWKRWLYERTRRGEVPGCVKLGGSLFFDAEAVRGWIAAGAPSLQPTGAAS